jgi:predicted metal-dependent HD superfamily phosphohydrolase
MDEKNIDQIKLRVLAALEGLSPHLTYHSVGHTLDVVRESERIAREEGISSERELFLLKIAAFYHDTGFLQTYAGHEEKSCELFMRDAADYGLTDPEKNMVKALIMATRVPQQPSTQLERIICDADLDYLGRSDFQEIGARLKLEFLHYKVVKDEQDWERLQLQFLKNHQYHTASSQRLREPLKQSNYQQLL